MKHFHPLLSASAILLLGASLSACDKGDDVSIESITPGSECINGGVQITINGEAHRSCNGDPSTSILSEDIEHGAPGNPCLGAAIKMTIQKQGQPAQEAWVCQRASLEDASAFSQFLYTNASRDIQPQLIHGERAIQCAQEAGEFEEADRASLSLDIIATGLKHFESCVINASSYLPPVRSEALEVLACFNRLSEEYADCFKATEFSDGEAIDFCDEDPAYRSRIDDQVDDCIDNTVSTSTCFSNQDRSVMLELEAYHMLVTNQCAHLLNRLF